MKKYRMVLLAWLFSSIPMTVIADIDKNSDAYRQGGVVAKIFIVIFIIAVLFKVLKK
ncbi:MAG: hypothetical protein ACAH12_04555 [Methylophilaceae bacterium]